MNFLLPRFVPPQRAFEDWVDLPRGRLVRDGLITRRGDVGVPYVRLDVEYQHVRISAMNEILDSARLGEVFDFRIFESSICERRLKQP